MLLQQNRGSNSTKQNLDFFCIMKTPGGEGDLETMQIGSYEGYTGNVVAEATMAGPFNPS